jgi:hypothetical protein
MRELPRDAEIVDLFEKIAGKRAFAAPSDE